MKIKAIFISHFHGDHYLGLPGLMQTMSLAGYRHPLSIFGPEGTVDFIYHMFLSGYVNVDFSRKLYELKDGETVNGRDISVPSLEIQAFSLDHDVPALGYVVKEKPGRWRVDRETLNRMGLRPGKWLKNLINGETVQINGRTVHPEEILMPPPPGRKIVYALDTRPMRKTVEMARGADVLVHDATGSDSIRDKMHSYGHSTARDAARIAKRARVKMLVLTHISPRYDDDASVLLEEAREVFPYTIMAEDGMKLEVKRA